MHKTERPSHLCLVERHDRAHEDARRLREEAIAKLWSDLDDALGAAADTARRAAHRFAYRWGRHRELRGGGTAESAAKKA
jgi:hypothetical protein